MIGTVRYCLSMRIKGLLGSILRIEGMDVNDSCRRSARQFYSLPAKHGAQNVRVFGSVARREANEQSDVDFLVDYGARPQPPGYGGLLMDLRELLGREVDVVTEKAFIGCYVVAFSRKLCRYEERPPRLPGTYLGMRLRRLSASPVAVREAFLPEELIQDAVIRNLEIIGRLPSVSMMVPSDTRADPWGLWRLARCAHPSVRGIELGQGLDRVETGLASDQTSYRCRASSPGNNSKREMQGKQITLMHLERLASQSRVVYTHERRTRQQEPIGVTDVPEVQEKGIQWAWRPCFGRGVIPRSSTKLSILGEENIRFSPFRFVTACCGMESWRPGDRIRCGPVLGLSSHAFRRARPTC